MRVRLGIDIIADEPARAALAEAVVEQPVVQVQIGVLKDGTFTGRFVNATLIEESEQ